MYINAVNQFTANCFASITPPCEYTITSRIDSDIHNCRDLSDMFNILGGHLFLVMGNGIFHYERESVKAFVWVPTFTKEMIHYGNCIEFDASFKAVDPSVFCVPMSIYHNT